MIARLFATVAVVALLTPALGSAQDEAPLPPDSVAVTVFEAELLTGLTMPAVLHYRYEIAGQGIETPFSTSAEMRLEDGDAEGDKAASFRLFEGPNKREFGPVSARAQNPMILVFLQRDVTTMGKLTGGSASYFQRGLRQGFRDAGEVETIEVEIGGESVSVDKISIRPFENDPQIGRFPQFRDKTYNFWVGDDVPGGLYRIETVTPDVENGELILSESLTFERLE